MLSFTNLALRRGPNLLFEDASFVIHHDKKVGLIGANGAGKTSLFKMITGELDVEEGYLDYPQDLRISYLAQEVPSTDEVAVQYVLEGDKQLIEIQEKIKLAETNEQFEALGELHAIFNSMDGYAALSKAEQLMIGLGFTQEDLSKSVKDFSGGWRVRLNLARTLMQPSDLLLLDEPTTHLDMASIDTLIDALSQYSGTMVFISHDVHFIRKIAKYVIHVEDGKLRHFPGPYQYYLDKTNQDSNRSAEASFSNDTNTKNTSKAKREDPKSRKRREAEERQALSKKRNENKAVIDRLETRITVMEKRQKEITELLEQPETYAAGGQAPALNRELMTINDDLDDCNSKWSEAVDSLNAIE